MTLPDPVHPLIVHFPIVLALLAPFTAGALFWVIRSGRAPVRAWAAVVALQVAVAGSAWVAVETGEHEEERVERVVAESAIEEHEESAERFLWIAALIVPLAAAGLLSGPVGIAARGLATAATLGAALAVAATGHSGGELVYRHGAATAYLDPGAGRTGADVAAQGSDWLRGGHEEHDDD
jgi:uncharacterized membrane protein